MAKRRRTRQEAKPAEPAPARARSTRFAAWPYVLLIAVTLFAFAPVGDFELVDFDDLTYINDNPHVTSGLTRENITWAFTHAHEGNWIPLTWISYMVDFELGGLDGGQYHITNVVLHLATACLLFGLLNTMTRARLPSAFVALLFAIHPLHVESVAWVAERKDVLSGLLWCLTIAAYVGYVRRPGALRYALVALAFVSAVMAKPMAVTLPFVLLLLDYWPLARWKSASGVRRVLLEKIPLVVIAVVIGIVTLRVQGAAGAVVSLESVPLIVRIQNAFVSYATYLIKTIWPSGLAALYPYAVDVPIWQPLAAALLLGAISWLAWRTARTLPFIPVGWLWYLVTVAPVSGLIHTGPQARADRYTYLPMIGIGIMIGFGLDHLTRRLPSQRRVILAAASAALIAFAVVARQQVLYWKDTETVFRRAIAVTNGNYIAHAALGTALRHQGRVDEAIASYRRALQISPRNAEAHAGLGVSLLGQDRPEEALAHLRAAIQSKPNVPEFHVNLGTAFHALGRRDEALAAYREAVRLAPHRADARSGLGGVLAAQGNADAALVEFNEAVRLDPAFVDAPYNLGLLLTQLGRDAEAVPSLQQAARLAPGSVQAHVGLAGALARLNRHDEAIASLNTAIRLEPANARLHNNLAGVLLAAGRLDEAIAHLTEATRLEPEVVEFKRNLDLALRTKKGAGL